MLTERLADAFVCAHAFHRDQPRKGSDRPYIGHLMAVASLVLDADGDENAAIAGLLHDALEDQGGSRAANEIERRFGREVLGVVRECSDWSGDGEKPAWRSRKQAFVNSVSEMSSRALLVAAADKLHNVRDLHEDYLALGEDLWERFNGGRDGTLWYYRAMAAALCEAGAPRRLVDPLQRAIDELAQLMETAE